MYKVLDLLGVSPEEKSAIEAALDKANIHYYETSKSSSGERQPAIWVEFESQVAEAIHTIQMERNRLGKGAENEDYGDSPGFGISAIFWFVFFVSAISLLWSFWGPGNR